MFKYNFSCYYDDKRNEYVGICEQYPGTKAYAKTIDKALLEIKAVVSQIERMII